jgi:hypothetical protein
MEADEDTEQPKAKRRKKEPEEKRVDEHGNTVRYSAHPSQKTRERIDRALPGRSARDCLCSL